MNDDLYIIAYKNKIPVDSITLDGIDCVSVAHKDRCSIIINPVNVCSNADERVKLAHELGHCVTGSFYNIYSPLDNRRQKELIANRWAINELVPKDKLIKACKEGTTSIWELAEMFDVTVDFMAMTVDYYHCAQ